MQFGIAEAVDHWAKYRPRSIAAYASGSSWTYAELNDLAATMAAEVERVAGGHQRVAVAFGSKLRLLAAILGVLRTGRSVVLVNTGLPIETIRINLEDAAVRALLYEDSQSYLEKLVPSSAGAPTVALDPPSAVPLTQRGPSDEWGVLFTSGTTGVPKGIERYHDSMVTELVGWCLELGLTRHSRFYVGRPIFYTGGLVLTLATLLVGGAAILNEYQGDDSFDDTWADYQRSLEEMSIDFAFFIPDQLRRFVSLAATQGPRTARTVLTMGSRITGAEKQQIVTALGCQIIESWGNSESLGTITDPEDVYVRPDSIGRPFLTDDMCVVDEECRPVQATLSGRLAGSESAGFFQYCNRPTETLRTKRNALIISEDIGHRDENGFFYIKGRSQDFVVLPDGSTVFLEELERALRELSMFRDCCVVATPNGIGEARFLVAVVLAGTPEDADFAEAVRRQLAPRITVAEIRRFDDLPRMPSGKVNRLAVEETFGHAG